MKKALATVVLVGLAGIAIVAFPGVLDTSFNGTGLVSTSFAIAGVGSFHAATGVAVDSQRRTVAVGLTTAGPSTTIYDVAIARYTPDGTLDTTFNGTGKVIHDFGGDDRVAAVAIDVFDRIVIAGETDARPGCNISCGGHYDVFIARFNVDGSIDTTFGDNGSRIVDLGNDSDTATALAIDPSGLIIVGGWTSDDHAEVALIRLLPDGDRDTSFNGDGVVISDLSPDFFAATTALAIDKFGRYVVTVDIGGFAAVARYDNDGSLDPQFGVPVFGNSTEPCNYVAFKGVAIDAGGRIVATGYCSGDTFEGPGVAVLTVRLTPDGSGDTTFGTNGAILSQFGSGTQQAMAVAVDPLSRVTIAGFAQGCGSDMLIARFDGTGAPDQHFGDNSSGVSLIDFGACTDDAAVAMAVDQVSGGDYLLAGTTAPDAGHTNFGIARVLTNHPDYSFSSPVAPIALAPGNSGSTTVQVNSIDGFDDALKIQPLPLPAGFTWAFDGIAGAKFLPIPAWSFATTSFQVTADVTVAPGTYTFTLFDARRQDPGHTALVTVTVMPQLFTFAQTIGGFAQSGYIDNGGIANSLAREAGNASQSAANGQVQAALGQLRALEQHVSAQSGKHIAASAVVSGQTIDPAAVLIADIEALIAQLGG